MKTGFFMNSRLSVQKASFGVEGHLEDYLISYFQRLMDSSAIDSLCFPAAPTWDEISSPEERLCKKGS
jgi:hypothetical protein